MLTSESHVNFHKSSYSSAKGQDCVEFAEFATGAAVRDTQNRELGPLSFPPLEWTALLRSATGQ
nr:DUF397 domain-containing protein [Nocardiopsis xinjiangensis]